MSEQTASLRVRPGGSLAGTARVPGDKSLSHRALLLGMLADGVSRVRGFLPAGDTLATLRCVRQLGAEVKQDPDGSLTVIGCGLGGLQPPVEPLDCVNAGTAMRLLAGILAGQSFPSILDGSPQLRRRPMRRIIEPLAQMGAIIMAEDDRAPLQFAPAALQGITYNMLVASAQVKSCLLLAGLFAQGVTTIAEPGPARDHTERMLRAMGAQITQEDNRVSLDPCDALEPLDLTIPADPSSAAFLIAAGLLAGTGPVLLPGVGVNPTRTGLLDVLALMGAPVIQENPRDEGGEPAADLCVTPASLRGAEVGGELIVRAIDEFPALMVLATQAEGETLVRDATELRVKETDRIAVMAGELRKLGAEVEERADGFRVVGPQRLRGATVHGHDDHRVAMALAVAALVAEGETLIEDAACMHDSFPGFSDVLAGLGADVSWEAA